MKRVIVWVSILSLLLLGIPFVVGGTWMFFGLQGNDDPDLGLFAALLGSLALFIGIPPCLGAGFLAARLKSWRSQQAPGQEAGRHNGATMRKTMAGAAIGFCAGGLLVFAVVSIGLALETVVMHALIIGFASSPFGAVPGLVIGAVAGLGWKAKTADAVVSRPQQGVFSHSDVLKPQPRQVKCPFCHSTTFRALEETGSRRCSDCHSVLPNYILGNDQPTGQM